MSFMKTSRPRSSTKFLTNCPKRAADALRTKPGVIRSAEVRAPVDAGRLSSVRRLPGMGENPARAHAARKDHRRRESIGSARPWRCSLSHRREVELHAAQLAGAEIRGLQHGRVRAGHLPLPRDPALKPALDVLKHRHKR